MHGTHPNGLKHRTSIPAFGYVLGRDDKEFLSRHTRRFARALIRRYETLGEDYKGAHRFDEQKQTLRIYLMRPPEDDDMPSYDAQITLDVGLKHTNAGRRLCVKGEVVRPDYDSIIRLDMQLGADPVQQTDEFLGTMVKHHFIENDEALRFLPEDNGETETKRRRRWSVRERFVRSKMSNLQRAFLQDQGHLFTTVKFVVKPESQTFRLTFHAKKAFEGRHVVIEGSYKVSGWDSDKNRPTKMSLNIGKTSIRRDFDLAAGLEVIDLAIDNHHTLAVGHLAYILQEAKALRINAEVERLAKKDRRLRPDREERSQGHRSDRRSRRAGSRMIIKAPHAN